MFLLLLTQCLYSQLGNFYVVALTVVSMLTVVTVVGNQVTVLTVVNLVGNVVLVTIMVCNPCGLSADAMERHLWRSLEAGASGSGDCGCQRGNCGDFGQCGW